MKQQTPPMILVKTWLSLLSTEDEEARLHAKRMLEIAFGSVELALIYIEQAPEKLRA
jgi:hypothetical protein